MFITANALGLNMQFLDEQRTESYIKYDEGVAQAKIVYYPKSDLIKRTLFVLERRGA